MNTSINKGIGAGGANTTYYGKKFEEKTNNHSNLIEQGWTNHNYYLSQKFEDKTIIFTKQSGLKKYMKYKYNIDLFRFPDEAYIIEYDNGNKVIKILEKKEQNVAGSVETKLWAGPSLKREYQIVIGDDFDVVYGFCINNYLKNKLESPQPKYTTLTQILQENEIEVLFGDDDNYMDTLNNWLIGYN
jgi:hypothetical protein